MTCLYDKKNRYVKANINHYLHIDVKPLSFKEAGDLESTLMVSRQPCSSARTVTMSSMQPGNDKQC